MKLKTLHQRKRKYFLLILLLSVAGMTKMYAQDFGRISRDATMQPVQQKKADYDSGFATIQETNSSPRSIRSNGELDYTTYDWQTNAGPITRTIVWPDGKVNFAFTQAFNSSFTDRGTAIGTYDAMNDEWIPSEGRVENQKTGFGSIARYGENGIVVAAHTSTDCRIYIIEDKDNIEANSVSSTSILDGTNDIEWPNVMTSGPNRNIIHVVATAYDYVSIPGMENVNQPILYFRSQDGGQTWDRQNVVLPFMDANYCIDWGSNVCYWMETTEDNCLALVVNNAWSDGMVIYSYDNGENWQRKVFYKHPNPFDTFDEMFLYPRWTSCQWDNQHNLHVLYEFNGCIGAPGSGSYYPSNGGVAYWNENMPYNDNGTTQSAIPGNLIPGQPFILDNDYLYNDIYASLWCFSGPFHQMWPEYIGYLPPLDDNGNWENPNTTNSFNIDIANFGLHGSYNSGICGFPVLCMVPDTDDDMVAVWCAMDENHTDSNGNYYYKIFASYSGDGGAHWTNMVHLTNNFHFQDKECVYLQASVVNNKLVIACQMDSTTGTFVQNDDSDPYDNYYQGLTFDLEVLFGDPSYFTYISATANPSYGGTISGGGMYQQGQTCMLTATANDGYSFVNWTKDGVEVSTDTIFSFIVTETGEYVANFSSLPYEITAVANPTEGGIITGNGIYNYGQSCTLTAVASEGYTFMYWAENGNAVSADASYSFTVTGNRTLVANFVEGNVCAITFNLYDSYGDGWNGNKLVVTDGNGTSQQLTFSSGSSTTYTLYFVDGSHVTLGWISGSYIGECSFTVSYSNGNVIYYGSNLNSSFSYEFNVDCEGMPAISFDITAVTNPEEGGTVTGTGEYNYGTTCTLTATANEGYTFMYWTENGYQVSSDSTYSFFVSNDRSFVAHFALPFSITATADPTDGGVVTGGGEYDYGSTCTLTATPNEGYCFYYWAEDGYIASFDTIFSFIVTTDREYVGVFGLPLSITAEASPNEGGSVIGGGVFDYGSTCTLTATANEGYTFMYWTENGQQISSNSTYSFTVTNDRSFVAYFTLPFNITATANPTNGGTVIGTGEYDYGSTCTLTAIPNENYLFLNWSRNGEVVGYNATYSFTVTEDVDLEAVFMLLEGVLIGEGEATNYYLPSYSYYCYTLSQQIYTPDEIGEAGSITSISYFNAGGTKTRSYDIYMVHTDKSSFENNNDWIAISEVDRVYSGSVTMTKGYWTTIELNTPFIYDGTSNLVIIVDDNTGSYTGSPHMACRVFYTEGNQAIRIYSDGTNYNPYNPTQYNGTLYMEKNQIILGFLDPDYRFISVSTNPRGVGTIDGGGYYQLGDTCTLSATASNVYEFVNWTKDGIIVSDNPTYSFIVTENASYSANFLWINPASTDYVSDGLIMYLDGIYNTRSGHSTTTNVWEDLIGSYDLTLNNYYSYLWEDNHFIGLGNGGYLNTGQTWQYFNSLNDDLTIEIVTYIDCDKTSPSYRGLAGWHEWSDGTNFQNDQGSSIMQTLGQLPVTEADDQIATVSYTRNNGSFLDGVWKTDASNLPNGVSSSKIVVFGNSYAYSRGWNDSIYCIRMYNRSLTPEEIAYNHNIDVERFIEGNYTIDTTIYAEICQGDDYLQNGFEIYYPGIGENQYSITLPSSQNTDSIVNLTLSVHPTYFFVEDTALCNTTSFEWRGVIYSESGIYYDSLQTIYGCDSIFQLSLELFNIPVGDFTYMSPTDNYPFTSMPITFAWDAVPNAESYDLYVWDADETMPEVPFASNLRYGNYSTSALQNYHTYNWYVKARNACYEVSSTVRNFYLDITPSLNVNVNRIDFGEVAMNQSASATINVSGIVLEDALDVQITGEDATMFSFTQASGWNNYNGGILIVTFNPTMPQYTYSANLVVSSDTFTETITLIGAVSNLYTFNTYAAEDVYAMNSQIPVYGSVTDWNNAPVADAEVEIGVFVIGMKRTLQAMTDTNGQFSAVFEPMPSESGYYTVNSGRVGNHNTAVHDDFNIPGMSVVTSDYILCAVTQDQPKTDSILIRNKSNLPLSNIQLQTLSAPEGCAFSFSPMSLGGLEEDYLVYTVTGSTLTQGKYYEEVRLKATSDEGAETIITAWYYCMEPKGVLEVIPQSLANTMTKGKSKIVDVMLTNNGTAATGNITIDLPDVEWMSVVGSDTLSSLAVNDTAYFSLRFSPAEDIQLGQYSGAIAINSERGDAIALPYTITAVSDSTGILVVDVTDDYTWNTNNGNGPHLEGAEVTLKGYYSLETVAYGFTDADGHFSVEDLPEGYYRLSVTAERHTDYNSVVFVEAGANGRSYTNVYLQYQAVTYSWIVEPTEIEDMYTYELFVEYETNVPVPVITIEHTGIHALENGESANFNLIITNHGLIDAYDTHIYFTEAEDYIFIPLYDIIDTLSALTTVVIPGTYYRNDDRNNNREWIGNCNVNCYAISVYYCNADGGWTPLINYSELFTLGICFAEIGGNNGGGGGGIPGFNTSISGPIAPYDDKEKDDEIDVSEESCDPCVDKLVNVLSDLIDTTLPGCLALNLLTQGGLAVAHGDPKYLMDLLTAEIGCLFTGTLGEIYSIASALEDARELLNCVKVEIYEDKNGYWRDDMNNVQNTIDGLYFSSYYLYNELMFIRAIFSDDAWDNEENVAEFLDLFVSMINPDNSKVSNDDAINLASTFVGTSVSYDDIINIADRWNRSVDYWSYGYYVIADLPEGYDTNYIQINYDLVNEMLSIENYYSDGYESMQDLYEQSVDNGSVLLNNASQSSVCAHVKVKFSQKMTMTREAFDGTLTIHNGHPTEPIEAINVNLVIKDSAGNDCTSLFQINTLSLNNITGIDGTGSISGGMDGIAKIQFIPTRLAAPTTSIVYYFGGSFSFIDPYSGEEILYDLYPVEITVNPSCDLHVDYFMQRDILGDDALTEDIIEPSVPAELGVIIHNQGAGEAKNVTLETAEPQIVDNEKGLAIDFAMYGASFNGSPRQLGLMEIPFGNIGSGQTAVGEWLFTSSLLGHFVSYTAHVIHNSSYGNPDLSLVSHLDIHELIHPIYAYGNLDDGINDFLVNDNPDAYDTPDSIYFSHGGKTSVGVVDGISFDHYVSPSDTIVTLTVVPSRIGWNYGVTEDPGMNQYDIVSCIRNNDNQVIPLNNVWLTFVTIPDGGDPVYENKLHIVDTIPVQQTTTYTLVFAKKPSNLRIFHGNEDEYWSNAANWEGYILPQADDEVLIDGICQLDQDAEVFSLTVAENQSLTIPEDRILTVSGTLTSASVSRLIIEEGGQLFHGNTGVQATVQKTIMPYIEGENDGWYFIASPLAGSTSVTSVANMLDNEYDLYYYDEPTAYWMNQEYAPNGFSELVNGKGYLYANSDEVLLGFAGELQSGSSTVTVYLNYTEGGDLQGFNLVGNPFVYNLTSYASVNVANGCYQLNEAKDDLLVSEIDEANPLKPAEGFFVKATDVGASITFNPGRSKTANRSGSIRVELLDGGKLIDRLIVKMEGEPLEKMSLKEQRTKVFATQNRQEIAIVPCESNEQPVNFKAAKDGTYTINVNTNGLEFNYLHLIDNLTGVDVDLLALRQAQGPMTYTFEAKTTDYASRFRLVFSVCGDADGDDVPFAFINNGNIIIVGAEADAVLQIVDVLGRVLVCRDASNASAISTSGMAPGVYVLRLIEGEKERTQKIVVK